MTDGSAIGVTGTLAADGKQYRICQAGHEATVGAFDALSQFVDELLAGAKGKK